MQPGDVRSLDYKHVIYCMVHVTVLKVGKAYKLIGLLIDCLTGCPTQCQTSTDWCLNFKKFSWHAVNFCSYLTREQAEGLEGEGEEAAPEEEEEEPKEMTLDEYKAKQTVVSLHS